LLVFRSGYARSSPPLILCFLFPPSSTTQFYTLSLHDALPISLAFDYADLGVKFRMLFPAVLLLDAVWTATPLLFLGQLQGLVLRSEEHTSELQSRGHLVCRLLLEKKKRDP